MTRVVLISPPRSMIWVKARLLRPSLQLNQISAAEADVPIPGRFEVSAITSH